MHTVFVLLCFVVVIHWLIFPYPSGLLHWHCGNLTIAPMPAKQPWWIWINTACEFIMNDCITTTKQSTTKPCAYFLGYTVFVTSYQIHTEYTCRTNRHLVLTFMEINKQIIYNQHVSVGVSGVENQTSPLCTREIINILYPRVIFHGTIYSWTVERDHT